MQWLERGSDVRNIRFFAAKAKHDASLPLEETARFFSLISLLFVHRFVTRSHHFSFAASSLLLDTYRSPFRRSDLAKKRTALQTASSGRGRFGRSSGWSSSLKQASGHFRALTNFLHRARILNHLSFLHRYPPNSPFSQLTHRC
jgi:hypothetical protein